MWEGKCMLQLIGEIPNFDLKHVVGAKGLPCIIPEACCGMG